MRRALLLLLLAACGGHQAAPAKPAGAAKPAKVVKARSPQPDAAAIASLFGGELYGGALYGGDAVELSQFIDLAGLGDLEGLEGGVIGGVADGRGFGGVADNFYGGLIGVAPPPIAVGDTLTITDGGKIYGQINAGACLSWPSDDIKAAAGKTRWDRDGFSPGAGARGKVVAVASHCATGAAVYILHVGDHYVPVAEAGVERAEAAEADSDADDDAGGDADDQGSP